MLLDPKRQLDETKYRKNGFIIWNNETKEGVTDNTMYLH